MHEHPDTVESVNNGRLAYLPVSLFGAVMGLCGLALAWRYAATHFDLPTWIGEAVGLVAAGVFVVLTLCYAIKCIESPDAVRAELSHPVTVNFFGTPIISLLLLPAVIAPYSIVLTKVLWTVGTLSMLGFAWLIVGRWMSVRQQIVHATPAWMIPIVGTLNISIVGVTLDIPGAHEVSAFGLAVGLFFAVPLFTLILSRLIFGEQMLQSQQPSLLIFVATFAVSFSAYLSVVGRVDLFASSLFYLAIFMFTVLVPKLLRLRSQMPFHTSWWAVSFPLAAMSNAALKFAVHQPSLPAQVFALAVLAFTSFIILAGSVRTISAIVRGELRTLTL
jgi:tellurite resistance protein